VLPELPHPGGPGRPFLYAALLLLIVLIIPGGIADLLDYKNRPPARSAIARSFPVPELLARVLDRRSGGDVLSLSNVELSFGGVRAIGWAGSADPAGRGAMG